MNNDKELREKLLTANSGEEIKALLGDQVTEEEADLLFQEIRKRKEADDLKALDDGNLEDVAGGMKVVSVKAPDRMDPLSWLRKLLFGD